MKQLLILPVLLLLGGCPAATNPFVKMPDYPPTVLQECKELEQTAIDALIVIVFVVVFVLMVILLPAIKDSVSEPLVANIKELLELIVSKENWLLM